MDVTRVTMATNRGDEVKRFYLAMVKNHVINYWVKIQIPLWIILEQGRARE